MTAVAADATAAHAAAVERLLDSYRAIPRGATVRLAKPTSNLFRARTRTKTKGLDVSGLDGVLARGKAEPGDKAKERAEKKAEKAAAPAEAAAE